MIKCFKLKPILGILAIILVSTLLSMGVVAATNIKAEPKFNYTIVLDAGHGGRDNGCSGVNTGVAESELNLSVTKKLQKYLSDFGFDVVLTRTNSDGLYSHNVDNYKKDDMEKRSNIIENANANMVISIHMNSFPSPTERGAQVFFDATNEQSKALAQALQNQLISDIEYARKESQKGDYYILNCIDVPTAIVECGFLTNPDEELLLMDPDYQSKLAYSIFCGIIRYLSATDTTIMQ